MNDQDNIGLIRKIYAAFGTGDVQTILDSVADGAGWIHHDPTTGGKVIADNFIAQGDAVVALGSYKATVRTTGAEIDTPIAHIFTVRNGKVVRWEGFSDTALVAAAHTGKASTGNHSVSR